MIQFNNISGINEYLKYDGINFIISWASSSDMISSERIKGKYRPLKIEFRDNGLIDLNNKNFTYTLLIDRYRHFERKSNQDRKIRYPKYRHEIIPDPNGYDSGRINEIVINAPVMLLDFKQDFYFKKFTIFQNVNNFPAATGNSTERFQIKNNSNRKGWVNLGFRVRISDKKTEKVIYETSQLNKIKMLGLSTIDEFGKLKNEITYSLN